MSSFNLVSENSLTEWQNYWFYSVQHRKTLNGSLKNKSLQEQAFCADAMKTNANSILQMLGVLSQEFPQICESIKIQTSKVG